MSFDQKAFHRTLPTKRIAAGAIFLNEAGHVLLVNPTYKDEWETPGGVVEANESPLQGCIREVKEETGLEIRPERLLTVLYKPETDRSTESMVLLFAGGVLSDAEIRCIVLPDDELSEFRFIAAEKLGEFLHPQAAWQVGESVAIWGTEKTVYLDG